MTEFAQTQQKAIYHQDSDCVEYSRQDGHVYYERIDEFLTLVRDMSSRQTVGFKLKGFKYLFRPTIEALSISDAEFLVLMRALERHVTIFGDKITDDCREYYDEAIQIASNDNVLVETQSLREAA